MYIFSCIKISLWQILLSIQILQFTLQQCNDTNCASCSSTNPYSCQTCNSAFNLANGTCCSNSLQNCASCFSSPSICDSCSNNSFAVLGGACSTCASLITGCLTCSNSTSCSSCVSNQYILNSSSLCQACSSLMDGCVNCSASNVCIACVNNSIAIDPNTNRCQNCSSLINNCLTCNSSTVCTACVNNTYALNSSSCASCSLLMDGCLNCDSSTLCTVCTNITYILNSSKCQLCSSFLSNCLNCSSMTICTACVNDTFTIAPNTSSCTPCSILLDNCDACNSSTICTSCNSSSFFLNSTNQCNICQIALYGCRRCSNSATCTRCLNNSYVLNTTSQQCVDCNAYLPYCSICQNTNVCSTCIVSPNIILDNRVCVTCDSVISNCLNCTKTNKTKVCTVCSKYYTIQTNKCTLCGNAMSGCLDCSSTIVCKLCGTGQIVINGCSSVIGCTTVAQNPPTSICTACDPTLFKPNPVNGKCVCLDGNLVGQYCTLIIGCTRVVHKNNKYQCTSCNQALNFILNNGTCFCQKYYEIKDKVCTETCGDGVVITLPCDDGNLISGDGCSSTCQKQSGYRCHVLVPNQPSTCTYEGLVQLKFVCVYKYEDNMAKIILTTNPYISNIQKSNLNLTFNTAKNCTMTNYQIVAPNIEIYIEYRQDVEGAAASINLPFDRKYILSPTGSLTIQLNECNRDKLLYNLNPSKLTKKIILFIINILSILVLLVWLIGSYSHKMIGVQTLHTFHLIVITQVFAIRYFPVFNYFTQLSNTLNLFQNKLTISQKLSQTLYSRLNYHSEFIYNSSIITIAQIIALLAFSVLYFLTSALKKGNKTINQQKSQNRYRILIKCKNFIYDFLVFPLFIGFYLNFGISLMIHQTSSISKDFLNTQTLGILFITITTYGIFVRQWKFLLITIKDESSQTYKQHYIPIYLTNLLFLSMIILCSLVHLISIPLYLLAASAFLYTIIIVVYRPYRDCLHNTSLVVNQLGVILNLGWLFTQKYIYLQKQQEEMFAFIIIAWMILIIALAIIRIIHQINKLSSKDKQNPTEKTPIKPNQSLNIYQNQIVNKIIQQTYTSINAYRIQSQINHNAQKQKKTNNKLKMLRNKLRYNLSQQENNGQGSNNQQTLKKPLAAYQYYQ